MIRWCFDTVSYMFLFTVNMKLQRLLYETVGNDNVVWLTKLINNKLNLFKSKDNFTLLIKHITTQSIMQYVLILKLKADSQLSIKRVLFRIKQVSSSPTLSLKSC